jgi:hypothetical protein
LRFRSYNYDSLQILHKKTWRGTTLQVKKITYSQIGWLLPNPENQVQFFEHKPNCELHTLGI